MAKNKIGIVVPVKEMAKIATLLSKEGLCPFVSDTDHPGIVILDVYVTQENLEEVTTKVERVMKKEAIDACHSN